MDLLMGQHASSRFNVILWCDLRASSLEPTHLVTLYHILSYKVALFFSLGDKCCILYRYCSILYQVTSGQVHLNPLIW